MKPLLKVNRRSKKDPTNQAGNRRKANRDNNNRLKKAQKRILALWSVVPVKRRTIKDIETNASFYDYENGIDYLEIQRILDQEFNTESALMPFAWYFNDYDEQAFRSGIFQENNLIWVILGEAGLITNEAIITSPFYIAALSTLQANDYRLIQNLSRTTSNQVYQVIQDGIDAGLSRKAISKQITRRFRVAKTSSERIVLTEINRAYNNARLDLAQFYIDDGQPLAILHISALLTTTRSWHAARHGHAFTPEAQRQWWDSNSNRINCYCSTRSAKTDKNGRIENQDAQLAIIDEGREFFK
jgi:hypothetical protein